MKVKVNGTEYEIIKSLSGYEGGHAVKEGLYITKDWGDGRIKIEHLVKYADDPKDEVWEDVDEGFGEYGDIEC